MKQWKLTGAGLAMMIVLAGCNDPNMMTEEEREILRGDGEMSRDFGAGTANFGNAVRSNILTQTVDPAPAYAEDPPKVDGQVILGAYGRYRTDKVKPPEVIGTGN